MTFNSFFGELILLLEVRSLQTSCHGALFFVCILFCQTPCVCIFIGPLYFVSVCDMCSRGKLKERERDWSQLSARFHHCHLGSASRLSCLSWSFHSRFETRDNVCPAAFSTHISWAWQQVGVCVCVCSGCKSLHCANRYWHILNYSLVNSDDEHWHIEVTYGDLAAQDHSERVWIKTIVIGSNEHLVHTSLNSWICVCSNMEKTFELAPSARFFAFLGACNNTAYLWLVK